MKKTMITVMCDYSAFGLWEDGLCTHFLNLPYLRVFNNKSMRNLEDRLFDWQETFESFHMYVLDDFETGKLIRSKRYKDFLKEGFEIAKLLRKALPSRYEVEYFNDLNSERIRIDKHMSKGLRYNQKKSLKIEEWKHSHLGR